MKDRIISSINIRTSENDGVFLKRKLPSFFVCSETMEEIAMKTLGYYNGKFGELDEMPVTKQELKDLLQEMVNKMGYG